MKTKITKRAKRKLAVDAARGLREGFSIAAAESDGRLAFARGESRETAGPTEPLARRAWLRGFDAEAELRAARAMSAEAKSRFRDELQKFKERIAGL